MTVKFMLCWTSSVLTTCFWQVRPSAVVRRWQAIRGHPSVTGRLSPKTTGGDTWGTIRAESRQALDLHKQAQARGAQGCRMRLVQPRRYTSKSPRLLKDPEKAEIPLCRVRLCENLRAPTVIVFVSRREWLL